MYRHEGAGTITQWVRICLAHSGTGFNSFGLLSLSRVIPEHRNKSNTECCQVWPKNKPTNKYKYKKVLHC